MPRAAWFLNPYLQLVAGGILDATGELLLKHGADAAERIVGSAGNVGGFYGFLVHTPGVSGLLSGWTWLGIISYIVGLLCWLSVLRTLPLTIAFPTLTVLHMLVPVGAQFLLHEVVPAKRWLGIAIAAAGILMILKPVAVAEEKL
jgi:undecaprenyl phosphate-alpha-L-ara4N flippase subunit ArnE